MSGRAALRRERERRRLRNREEAEARFWARLAPRSHQELPRAEEPGESLPRETKGFPGILGSLRRMAEILKGCGLREALWEVMRLERREIR